MTVQELYAYHRWANRRLFEVAVALGETECAREIGAHFSFRTLTGTFAHLYGADFVWLARWKGTSPTALPGPEFGSMAKVRAAWDPLISEQQAFVDALQPPDLERPLDYKGTDGRPFHSPLGVMLQHVVTHAAHHRSEIATMLTIVSGSPPDTGVIAWSRVITGQA